MLIWFLAVYMRYALDTFTLHFLPVPKTVFANKWLNGTERLLGTIEPALLSCWSQELNTGDIIIMWLWCSSSTASLQLHNSNSNKHYIKSHWLFVQGMSAILTFRLVAEMKSKGNAIEMQQVSQDFWESRLQKSESKNEDHRVILYYLYQYEGEFSRIYTLLVVFLWI